MAENNAPKSVSDMLKGGAICQVFGSKTLVSVNPAFEIDRVRISIVTIGTGGKDHNDIYLSAEEFRQFCEEIENGVAVKKFAADDTSKPRAYSWTKGDNGSKRLVIGKGLKGILVQSSIQVDGNWTNRQGIVQFSDLKAMAFMFRLVSGQIPLMEGSYYKKLYDAYASRTRQAN